MAIQPPRWCSAAVPTLRGWESPDGELLVSRKHSQAEIDAYNGIPTAPAPKPVVEKVVEEPKAEMLTEAPIGNVSLGDMTKTQLLALGEQIGLDVKSSWTKTVLVQTIEENLTSIKNNL